MFVMEKKLPLPLILLKIFIKHQRNKNNGAIKTRKEKYTVFYRVIIKIDIFFPLLNQIILDAF